MSNYIQSFGYISFILPIYNVEKYLEKCLKSIEGQTSSRWEAILVDDGSTDLSSKICKDFVARNSKFRYIYQENQGQGSARNNGLIVANGDYILFVDPDDWIESCMAEELLSIMDKSDADFVNFGIDFVTNKGVSKRIFNKFLFHELLGISIVHHAMLDDHVLSTPVNKIYRKSLLIQNNITFPFLRAYEDIFFSRKVALNSIKCLFVKQIYYHALIRPESTTRKLSPNHALQAIELIKLEIAEFMSAETVNIQKVIFDAHVQKLLSYLIFQFALRVKSNHDYRECVSVIFDSGFFKNSVPYSVMKHLKFLNRIVVRISRYPRLTRSLASFVTIIGFQPY